jgi:hypothetical protein
MKETRKEEERREPRSDRGWWIIGVPLLALIACILDRHALTVSIWPALASCVWAALRDNGPV